MTMDKYEKLICNLNGKGEHVHIQSLQQALTHGVILKLWNYEI